MNLLNENNIDNNINHYNVDIDANMHLNLIDENNIRIVN